MKPLTTCQPFMAGHDPSEKLAKLLSQVRPNQKVSRAIRVAIGDTVAPMLEENLTLNDIAARLGVSRARVWQISNCALGTLVCCLYLRTVARVPARCATPAAICGKGPSP